MTKGIKPGTGLGLAIVLVVSWMGLGTEWIPAYMTVYRGKGALVRPGEAVVVHLMRGVLGKQEDLKAAFPSVELERLTFPGIEVPADGKEWKVKYAEESWATFTFKGGTLPTFEMTITSRGTTYPKVTAAVAETGGSVLVVLGAVEDGESVSYALWFDFQAAREHWFSDGKG